MDEHRSSYALTVESPVLNTGDRLEGEPFVWQVPLLNTSNRIIHVSKISTSCNCAGVEPSAFSIAPNETQVLRLRLDLHADTNGFLDAKNHEIQITAFESAGEPPSTWTVRGRTRKVIDVQPRICDFSDDLQMGRPMRVVTLTARPRVSIADLKAEGPTGWRVDVRYNGEFYCIDVEPPSTQSAGEINEFVRLIPRTPNGTELPAINVPVRGEVIGEVEAFPKTARVGALPINSTAAHTFQVRSNRGIPLQIVKAVPGPGIAIESVGTTEIGYICTATKRGDCHTFVEAMVRVPDCREWKVRLDVYYYGY